jgi:serine/threonine protein kinase
MLCIVVRFISSSYTHSRFCEGGSIADIMNDTKVPLQEEQISVICRESLKGLAYLHDRKIVHRDIKGGNIMINSQGEVKLADFGVSAQLTESVNKKNTCVGTPFWMSPEVIMQTQHDGKADIWSLGITAIEMAEMAPPHNTVHPMRVLFLVPKEDPPKLQDQSQARWTPSFHSFIDTCLVKDPLRRPSALELLNHPFVANSLSVADVLLPLVVQAKSVKSAKSAATEQFETVLFSKGIPERVDMLSERFSESPPCAAAESEAENVQFAPTFNHKPAPDGHQSAHNEVELEYPNADCQIDSQDMHHSLIGVLCKKSDQAAGGLDSARCA